jgi:hypothetical protein
MEWVDYMLVGGEMGLEAQFYRWIALWGHMSIATYIAYEVRPVGLYHITLYGMCSIYDTKPGQVPCIITHYINPDITKTSGYPHCKQLSIVLHYI